MADDPYTRVFKHSEDAMERLIRKNKGPLLDDVAFFKGDQLDELTTPRIEIYAVKAIPEIIADTVTGNFWVDFKIAVTGNKGDLTRDVFTNRCGLVGDLLMDDGIVGLINTDPETRDFAARQFFPGDCERLTSGSELKRIYMARLYCRPSVPQE